MPKKRKDIILLALEEMRNKMVNNDFQSILNDNKYD